MKIFTLFGIPLYLHWSWFLLVGFFALHGGLALLVVLTAFVIVVLHEYGHCLMAKYLNIPVKDVILTPLGGMARIRLVNLTAKNEFLIAAAGPLVNVLFVLGLITFAPLFYDTPEEVPLFFYILLLVNALLLGFNLIPVFPMDGGRILRSFILWITENQHTATLIAVRIGQVLGIILAILAIYFGFIMAAVILCLMPFVAQSELSMATVRESVESIKKKLALVLNKPEIANLDLPEFIDTLKQMDEQEKAKIHDFDGVLEILQSVAE